MSNILNIFAEYSEIRAQF